MDGRGPWERSRITAVFAVAGARFHKHVVRASPHCAVVFVPRPFAWTAQEGTAADETPVSVHFLPDFATHRCPHAWQVFQLFDGTVIDGQRGVVKRVYAARVEIRTAHPTLDGSSFIKQQRNEDDEIQYGKMDGTLTFHFLGCVSNK